LLELTSAIVVLSWNLGSIYIYLCIFTCPASICILISFTLTRVNIRQASNHLCMHLASWWLLEWIDVENGNTTFH
jgi:hypothetical protein